jgi:hypothetical protein
MAKTHINPLLKAWRFVGRRIPTRISLPARAVIKREFLSGLRNPRPFFFLALFMAIMILGLLFILEVVYEHQLNRFGAINTSMVREIFMSFSMALYLSAALLVPPMAGVSICVEKQQDSYDLLRMTYIRPLSLALAKLGNVLGIYLLVVVASLPFVGVFFFLVGIDWDQFAISLSLIVLSAFSLASIGLLCSAWFYRTLPAIVTTYILGAATHGGIIMGLLVFAEFSGSNNYWFGRLIRQMGEEAIVPAIPFLAIALTSDGTLGTETILYTLIYHGGIAFFALLLTLAILRRPARPMLVDAEKPIDDQAMLKARRKKFPYYLLDPRRRRPMIPDGQNPVLAKESQTGLMAKGAFTIRVFYGFTLFSFVVSIFTVSNYLYGGQSSEMVAVAFFFDTVFILLVLPTLVSTAMAREWEWQNVDSLRMTLLSPHEIARGKFRAALRTALLPVGGALLGNVPLVLFGYDTLAFWIVGAMAFGGLLVCVFYTLALSFWSSAGARKSLTALMTAYCVCIVAIAVLPIAAMMLGSVVTGDSNINDQEALIYLFSSPLYAWFGLLELNRGVSSLEGLSYWFLNCLCFVGISMLLLSQATRRYNRCLVKEEK